MVQPEIAEGPSPLLRVAMDRTIRFPGVGVTLGVTVSGLLPENCCEWTSVGTDT